MTRIIAGHARGRNLATPAGDATRPTGARVRQVLFDILAPRLPGCRFLDLFAGSGAVGLEALSRGAARVVLVERAGPAVAAIQENVRRLGAGAALEVFRQDVQVAMGALARRGHRFDVIFLDPPYADGPYEEVLAAAPALLAKDGVLIAEHFHKRALPETMGRLARTRTARVGDHVLAFYAAREAGEGETA